MDRRETDGRGAARQRHCHLAGVATPYERLRPSACPQGFGRCGAAVLCERRNALLMQRSSDAQSSVQHACLCLPPCVCAAMLHSGAASMQFRSDIGLCRAPSQEHMHAPCTSRSLGSRSQRHRSAREAAHSHCSSHAARCLVPRPPPPHVPLLRQARSLAMAARAPGARHRHQAQGAAAHHAACSAAPYRSCSRFESRASALHRSLPACPNTAAAC